MKVTSNLNLEYRNIADMCEEIILYQFPEYDQNESYDKQEFLLTNFVEMFSAVEYLFISMGWDVDFYPQNYENCVMISKTIKNEKLFIWCSEYSAQKILLFGADEDSIEDYQGLQANDLEAENEVLFEIIKGYLSLFPAPKSGCD